MDEFIRNNPDLGEELERFQAVKLTPEEPFSFPDKKDLYRRGEKLAVFYRWPYAAAIAILITGGFVLVNYFLSGSDDLADNGHQTVTDTSFLSKGLAAEDMYKDTDLAVAEPDRRALDNPHAPATMVKKSEIKDSNKNNTEVKDAREEDADVKNTGAKNTFVKHKQNSDPHNAILYPGVGENAVSGSDERRTYETHQEEKEDLAIETKKMATKIAAAELYQYGDVKVKAPAPEITIPVGLVSGEVFAAADEGDSEGGSETYIQSKKNAIKSILHKASRIVDRTGESTSIKEVNIRVGRYEIAFQ
ncbi:MAG TPA: hypothetical protein PK339_09345 [Flavitalea sp.]|nr:hypothetical protein [Flavitalea sp.]